MRPPEYDRQWALLESMLPEGWREKARETGAIQRQRGLANPTSLLRLELMHVATGLSLRSTVARARAQDLAHMSDVGLLDRMRRSERWLRWMTTRLFTRSRYDRASRSAVLGRRQVRAFDATVITEPGATGTDWRVHLSVALPEMQCDFFTVTDAQGGETLNRIPVSPGDIVLGDRAYGHREAVAQLMRRGADVVVRLTHSNFPLETKSGRPFKILKHLRKLDGLRPRGWRVYFQAKGKQYEARLCAVRKTSPAAEVAKAKIQKLAKKKGKAVSAGRMEAAEYIFVLTTLAQSEYPLREVLELYRARWQVELVFKRLKSLLRLGHLPKTTDASSRAWLQAKLLVALLIEELMERAGFFSPWGHDEAAPATTSDATGQAT